MAKDKVLYGELRSRGVRKGTARKVSSALASRSGSEQPKAAKGAVDDLRAAASRIQERMALDEDRRAASRKAAKTRSKKAKKRSKGAKQLAAGRAGS
jgi:hypothetical protein